MSIVSLSTHSAVQMSVYLAYVYPSIKSVCPLVSQCIYPSVSLYSIHWYVCLHSLCQSQSTQIVFPHFQYITKHKTSSGVLFYEQITNALMHHCSNTPILKCTNTPMHQCTFFLESQIFCSPNFLNTLSYLKFWLYTLLLLLYPF